MTKSETKLTREDVNEYFSGDFDFQTFSKLLDNDLTDVVEFVRKLIVSKSVSKSIEIIDFLKSEKTRKEILKHLGLINHSKNYNNYIKPLLENEIIELTVPEKPNSRLQKYRLTEKGRKLVL